VKLSNEDQLRRLSAHSCEGAPLVVATRLDVVIYTRERELHALPVDTRGLLVLLDAAGFLDIPDSELATWKMPGFLRELLHNVRTLPQDYLLRGEWTEGLDKKVLQDNTIVLTCEDTWSARIKDGKVLSFKLLGDLKDSIFANKTEADSRILEGMARLGIGMSGVAPHRYRAAQMLRLAHNLLTYGGSYSLHGHSIVEVGEPDYVRFYGEEVATPLALRARTILGLSDLHQSPERNYFVLPPPKEKVTHTMSDKTNTSNPASLYERFKKGAAEEIPEAGIRVAARQMVKLTVEPLAALLAGPNAEPSARTAAASFLRSPLGKTMVGSVTGMALQQLVAKATNAEERTFWSRVAKELRVEAMATGGDMLADVVMEPLRAIMTNAISGLSLPEAPSSGGQLNNHSEVVDAPSYTEDRVHHN